MRSIIVLFGACAFTLFSSIPARAYTFDKDVPKQIQKQITQDLGFMQSLRLTRVSGLHREIFGQESSVYGKWFTDRVKGVGMSGCGSSIAVACVIPFFDSTKIWLTRNYVKFSHPQIAKMMVVFHEARHTETAHNNWPHAFCPVPFKDKDGRPIKSIWTGASLDGEMACDNTPYGSYSSSVILLKNISKFCRNCTDKVKLDAGLYADDQLKRVVAQSAIDKIRKDLY